MIQFSLKKIPIRIHFSFLLLLSVFLVTDEMGFGIKFLNAAFLHELGHLTAMKFFKMKIHSIDFKAFGFSINRNSQIFEFWKEFILYSAGIFVNFVCFLFMRNSIEGTFHFVLGFLNLLPISPMDGGKILDLFLENSNFEFLRKYISFFVEIVLILFGIWLCTEGSCAFLIFALLLIFAKK